MAEDHGSSGVVSGCMSEEDVALWVVILPRSNKIQLNRIKLNQLKVILCQYIPKVMQDYKYSCGY